MSENKIGIILKDHLSQLTFLTDFERRTLQNIMNCRTQVMGERRQKCECCGHEVILYNSCRNRNCPHCQGSQSFRWLSKRLDETLPVHYYHGVFTLPEELKRLFLAHKKLCLKILFKSVSRTLSQVAQKNLKIKIGFISILHTWDQRLNFHPHIHCVIPGGGLSSDHNQWISVRNKNYLLPVKKLSRVFRGKILFYLNKAFRQGLLKTDKTGFISLCAAAAKKEWVVYLKKPMGGAGQVLKYLSQYTHKIGISNRRIQSYDGKTVTFSWRDRRDGNREKSQSLSALLFIQRFILHIIPKRFVKIRFYGFMVNRLRKKLAGHCRDLIGRNSNTLENILPSISLLPFSDQQLCPVCQKGKMILVREIFSG